MKPLANTIMELEAIKELIHNKKDDLFFGVFTPKALLEKQAEIEALMQKQKFLEKKQEDIYRFAEFRKDPHNKKFAHVISEQKLKKYGLYHRVLTNVDYLPIKNDKCEFCDHVPSSTTGTILTLDPASTDEDSHIVYICDYCFLKRRKK